MTRLLYPFWALTLALCFTPHSVNARMPWLLMAGQSNMVGNPSEAGIRYTNSHPENAPGQSLQSLVEILVGNSASRRADLIEECKKVPSDPVEFIVDDAVAAFEVDSLLAIDDGEIFSNILNPVDEVVCTMDHPATYAFTGSLTTADKVNPDAGCGSPYGVELMMAHTLSNVLGSETYGMAKVASGGTTLAEWSDQTDVHWKALFDRIEDMESIHSNCRTGDCPIEAFVWFQGSQDTFSQGDPENYETNLASFINSVRGEIFRANPAGTHEQASDIPVVIIGIGCWRSGSVEGKLVVAAQEAFCLSDGECEFVKTDDLMCFYHYDPASMLIVGERTARAVSTLMEEQPSLHPSQAPSSESIITSRPSLVPLVDDPTEQPTVAEPSIVGFTLVDSATNSNIVDLVDGAEVAVLNQEEKINIVANTQGAIGSVQFYIDGILVRTESYAPYAIGGDANGDFYDWEFKLGTQELKATIYDGNGLQGRSLSIGLDIVERPSTATPTEEPTPDPTPLETPTPSTLPTSEPSEQQSPTPTQAPSIPQTPEPTLQPPIDPNGWQLPPTAQPSTQASLGSTLDPSALPTSELTLTPTGQPTPGPTDFPTIALTPVPTVQPPTDPNGFQLPPTVYPSAQPTHLPTVSPTIEFSTQPTLRESTELPSATPAVQPTFRPTTVAPTLEPTFQLTVAPTTDPTSSPTTNGPSVTSFTLVNSATNLDIFTLTDGTMIVLNETPKINIRANTAGEIGSVVFMIDGILQWQESFPPYALAGDYSGNYNQWYPKSLGTHTLTAIVYDGESNPGNSLSIQMTIVQVRTELDTPEPSSVPTLEPTPEPTASTLSPSAQTTLSPTELQNETPTPTLWPTTVPTHSPTVDATGKPSKYEDTSSPTGQPTIEPTTTPTASATMQPTTSALTSSPTEQPSSAPTRVPTVDVTLHPTVPTDTASPTTSPTIQRTPSPTEDTTPPTSRPTVQPTPSPTEDTAIEPSITAFTLVDSETDTDITVLSWGDTIDLSMTPNVNIRADTVGTIGSILFILNGKIVNVESFAPFAIAGDSGGDYAKWSTPPNGLYMLSALGYDEAGASGNMLGGLTISFTVSGAVRRLRANRYSSTSSTEM